MTNGSSGGGGEGGGRRRKRKSTTSSAGPTGAPARKGERGPSIKAGPIVTPVSDPVTIESNFALINKLQSEAAPLEADISGFSSGSIDRTLRGEAARVLEARFREDPNIGEKRQLSNEQFQRIKNILGGEEPFLQKETGISDRDVRGVGAGTIEPPIEEEPEQQGAFREALSAPLQALQNINDLLTIEGVQPIGNPLVLQTLAGGRFGGAKAGGVGKIVKTAGKEPFSEVAQAEKSIGFTQGVPKNAEVAKARGLNVVSEIGKKKVNLADTFVDVDAIGKAQRLSPEQIKRLATEIGRQRPLQVRDQILKANQNRFLTPTRKALLKTGVRGTAAVITTDAILTGWLGSDNILTGYEIYGRDLANSVKFGTTDPNVALADIDRSIAEIATTNYFIDKSMEYNPLLIPFRPTLKLNQEKNRVVMQFHRDTISQGQTAGF